MTLLSTGDSDKAMQNGEKIKELWSEVKVKEETCDGSIVKPSYEKSRPSSGNQLTTPKPAEEEDDLALSPRQLMILRKKIAADARGDEIKTATEEMAKNLEIARMRKENTFSTSEILTLQHTDLQPSYQTPQEKEHDQALKVNQLVNAAAGDMSPAAPDSSDDEGDEQPHTYSLPHGEYVKQHGIPKGLAVEDDSLGPVPPKTQNIFEDNNNTDEFIQAMEALNRTITIEGEKDQDTTPLMTTGANGDVDQIPAPGHTGPIRKFNPNASAGDTMDLSVTTTTDKAKNKEGEPKDVPGPYEEMYSLNKSLDDSDRPINPMQSTALYDSQFADLSLEEIVMEDGKLAETYYSQYEGEFNSDPSDVEGTNADGDEDESGESGDDADLLFVTKRKPKNKRKTKANTFDEFIGSVTTTTRCIRRNLTGDKVIEDGPNSIYSPAAKKSKIEALRKSCIERLGGEKFTEAFAFAYKYKVTEPYKLAEIEYQNGLKTICSTANTAFLVDQLIFLEFEEFHVEQ